MDKLKCVKTLDGGLVPLNAISKISPIESGEHYIWTNDGYCYNLPKEQYDALIKEIELIK